MNSGLDPSNIPDEQLWIVISAFVISFVLAFAVGANDVANAFGTSVGSKVLTLRGACILGTIFETSGAILLGSKVSGTIRSGIVKNEMYEGDPLLLMLGQWSSLMGCAIWLLIATFLKLPVSTTHSIVGATVGFTLVAKGFDSVVWERIVTIVISWVTSPLLSGAISVLLFWICSVAIINIKPSPLEAGLRALPLIYALTVSINCFSIILAAPTLLYFHYIPLWGNFVASFGIGLLLSIFIKVFVVPRMRVTIKKFVREKKKTDAEEAEKEKEALELKEREKSDESSDNEKTGEAETSFTEKRDNGQDDENEVTVIAKAEEEDKPRKGEDNDAFSKDEAEGESKKSDETETKKEDEKDEKDKKEEKDEKDKKEKPKIEDPPAVGRLFSFCQVVTAGFISFAHGGNDVANSIGPLIGIWILAITQDTTQSAQTPIWILLYGGIGMSVGLWIWGRRVMETVGTSLTTVTPSSGFNINFGAAVTVLLASNVGIPISTTHCIVGSVVAVGRFRSKDNIDWKLFVNIFLSWVVTLPAAIGLSALSMFILMQCYPQYDIHPDAQVLTTTASSLLF